MDTHEPHPRPWHSLSADAVCRALGSSPQGLSDAEAAARLVRDGPNELRGRPPKRLAAMLKDQLTDPMVLILIGASLLSAFLGEWTEAAVIAVIVAANAVIGTAQERKAQQALAALKELSAPTARVLREGEESVIDARGLVRGDIVFLRDGDRVPADLRLIDTAGLSIQEASLTGESVPSEKDSASVFAAETPLADRANMAYASSVVTYGRGTGVVTAAGMATEVGSVAELLDEQDELDTPLSRKLAAAGKTLTVIGAFVCLFIFAAGMWYGKPMTEQILLAISLAISIIPEGLPAAATIIMALSVKRLARQHALIRKLPAVETLGSATVICSDKTGTLTLNRMTVTALSAGADAVRGAAETPEDAARAPSDPCRRLVCAAALCNDASFDPDRPGEIIGDPTEGALIHLAKTFGIQHEALERTYPRLFEQPFDSEPEAHDHRTPHRLPHRRLHKGRAGRASPALHVASDRRRPPSHDGRRPRPHPGARADALRPRAPRTRLCRADALRRAGGRRRRGAGSHLPRPRGHDRPAAPRSEGRHPHLPRSGHPHGDDHRRPPHHRAGRRPGARPL